MKGELHGDRIWYWPPWSRTDWWKPDISFSGDEFCNDNVIVTVPPLGAFVIFYRGSEPLRNVMDDGYPCEKDAVAMLVEDRDADTSAWLWVDDCVICGDSWFLPRDRERKLCGHVAGTRGTDDPKLAYHVWWGGHKDHRCRCQRQQWFTPDAVMLAIAARKEERKEGNDRDFGSRP